jgi:hypothetical protein
MVSPVGFFAPGKTAHVPFKFYQSYMNPCLIQTSIHMCSASWGGHFPLNVLVGNVPLALGTQLYNQHNTKLTHNTSHNHTTTQHTHNNQDELCHPTPSYFLLSPWTGHQCHPQIIAPQLPHKCAQVASHRACAHRSQFSLF